MSIVLLLNIFSSYEYIVKTTQSPQVIYFISLVVKELKWFTQTGFENLSKP